MGVNTAIEPLPASGSPPEVANHNRASDSARALLRRLVSIYLAASMAAVVITLSLVLLGLELTGWQWVVILSMTPLAVAIYTSADLWLIARHTRPVRKALRALDAGEPAENEILVDALVRSLNLPVLSFLRVTFLHGPIVAVLVPAVMVLTEPWLHGGFQDWQVISFAGLVLFFASPTHAIFEFFAVSREMVPTIVRLSQAVGPNLPADYQKRIISVKLKSKLLYLAIIVTALPLVFFATSVIFKVQRILSAQGAAAEFNALLPFYLWIGGVVLICMWGAISMALLTANEVSRSATRLVEAMVQVQQNRLDDVSLDVVSTDEYGEINRGFRLMVDALQEEQRILEISHDLSGELQLDVLIARIMHEATNLLNAERSSLFVYDPKTDELFSLYAEGENIREIRISADRGIAGAVFRSGRLQNIADPYADPDFDPEVDKRTGFRTRSILCAPITNKAGERVGVTQVLNKKSGPFNAKDEARLRAFSAQIAVSIENARLFDDVLNMKNYNESILKSTSNGIITLDVDNVIVTANEAAQELLAMGGEQLVGLSASEAFVGENAWIAQSMRRTVRSSGTSLAVDVELARPGMDPATVNLTTMPLIDGSDEKIGSMLVMEDITTEKRVRSTMSRYMSAEVADQLLQSGEAELSGKNQNVSILFSDVRNFTTISETIGARNTVTMLNDYFTEMVDVVLQNKGILDKYIGDSIMALFGAPFVSEFDADNAVATANQMITVLRAHNRKRQDNGFEPLAIGLGISTGEVIVGNIGSVKRMEYTVIGDSVNMASRLEGANKAYGTSILISEFTRESLKRPVLIREIDRIRAKGKNRPVAVYESLQYRADELENGLAEMLDAYGEAIRAYQARDWKIALGGFEAALAAIGNDGPSAMYIERCRQFLRTPPGDDWDGVWELTQK